MWEERREHDHQCECVSWREAVESVKQNDWKFEKVDGNGEYFDNLIKSEPLRTTL